MHCLRWKKQTNPFYFLSRSQNLHFLTDSTPLEQRSWITTITLTRVFFYTQESVLLLQCRLWILSPPLLPSDTSTHNNPDNTGTSGECHLKQLSVPLTASALQPQHLELDFLVENTLGSKISCLHYYSLKGKDSRWITPLFIQIPGCIPSTNYKQSKSQLLQNFNAIQSLDGSWQV